MCKYNHLAVRSTVETVNSHTQKQVFMNRIYKLNTAHDDIQLSIVNTNDSTVTLSFVYLKYFEKVKSEKL